MTDNPSKILMVEDSETRAVFLSLLLEEKGYLVTWVVHPEKALEAVGKETFDLFIVEEQLPCMNGEQLLQKLKKHHPTQKIPILMLTDTPLGETEMKRDYADGVVSKHADPNKLLSAVHGLLNPSENTPADHITDLFLFKHFKILAVDDSPTYLEYITRSFMDDDIQIASTPHTDTALHWIMEKHFDCIMVDLMMPDMDGITLCQQILKQSIQKREPMVVMMLTAHENKEDMKKALDAGADDFVGKSSDISIIKTRLGALLRRKYIQEENLRIIAELKEKEIEAEKERIEKEAAQAKALLSDQLKVTVAQLKNEIKERKRIAKELQTAKEIADDASRAKSEFLANMSHELRSPLNSMLILSQLLAENQTNNLTDEQVEFAKIVQASGNDLLTMVNDILDLAKVEASKMELLPYMFNLKGFISDIERKFKVQAEQKNLKFVIRIADDAPEEITSDPQRLSQIIRNLLSNAFKFTEEGQVRLTVKSIPPDTTFSLSHLNKKESFAILISDTGIGIPTSKKRLIFESFTQVDGSTSRKYGGTGLGLTISKEFSRFLGGEIQLESEDKKGSTFSVYLPIHLQTTITLDNKESEEPEMSSQPHQSQQVTEGSYLVKEDLTLKTTKTHTELDLSDQILDGVKILLIDDDIRNIFTFISLFQRYKIKTIAGENGKKGFEKLNEHPDVSLIIMDLMMPVMDGYETITAIRAQEAFKDLPIIAVTAKAMKNDKEKCLKTGATDYLSKPVDIDALMTMIKKLLA